MRQLRVHILDVGHGDTIIVEIPIGNKGNIFGVIDCIQFEAKVKKYLEDLEVQELAFVCATHPHDDHIEGIQQLLETYNGNVREYWESGKEHVSQVYTNLLKYLSCQDDAPLFYLSDHDDILTPTIELIKSGTVVKYGQAKLHLLSPPSRLFRDSKVEAHNINNASIVIKIEYGDSKILLAGDAQFGGWAHMRVNCR